MAGPCRIDPKAIYDDPAICTLLGLKPDHLAHARRRGELRHSRKGGKTFYIGMWVLEWLTTNGARQRRWRRARDVRSPGAQQRQPWRGS